jgi:iron(III) transport system substrate-binding protein
VLAYNTERVDASRAPRNMVDLMSPSWRGRVGMARPQFGTTRGHMAALVALWGAPNAGSWMASMKANGLRLYDGNSSVVQAVASGEIDVGLTDTDDVWAGQRNGWPVGLVYIRHDLPGGARAGPLLIPNAASLVKGGPNPEAARLLLDHLLSPDTERVLARGESRNIPSNASVAGEFPELAVEDPAWAPLEHIAASMDEAMRLCDEMLGE